MEACKTCLQHHPDNVPCDVAAELIEAMQTWTSCGHVIVERGGNVVTLTVVE